MGFYYFLFCLPLLWITWALAFPLDAIMRIESWKRRLSHYIIQQMTRRETQLLKERLRIWGKLKGYEHGLIDEVLERHSHKIIMRIETRYSLVKLEELLE